MKNQIKAHYENLLSDVYSWMFGSVNNGVKEFSELFDRLNIRVEDSGKAVDLGCGCGFQSIPLARRGFSVVAIDSDKKMLTELKDNSASLNINIVNDDLFAFDSYASGNLELIVCMTDTILHLDSKQTVTKFLKKTYNALDRGGKLIISFRDLSSELVETDRFIPVRSDKNRILTCFLEYEPKAIKVHDILYENTNGKWVLNKSFYRKLRLSKDWVLKQLLNIQYEQNKIIENNGMITVVASKM